MALNLLAAAVSLVGPQMMFAPARQLCRSAVIMGRKPGVSDPADLAAFVAKAGSSVIVVDARNPGALVHACRPLRRP